MQRKARSFVLIASTVLTMAALAQEGETDAASEEEEILSPSTQRCLSLSRIRRTDVIDDETIVFYLRGGDIYINSLPRTCPGLERNDRFMYEVSQSRLCDTDLITVIEGFGVARHRGFTCRLGVFSPISEEALAVMMDAEEGVVSDQDSVEMKPIELPEPEDEPGEDEADAAPD